MFPATVAERSLEGRRKTCTSIRDFAEGRHEEALSRSLSSSPCLLFLPPSLSLSLFVLLGEESVNTGHRRLPRARGIARAGGWSLGGIAAQSISTDTHIHVIGYRGPARPCPCSTARRPLGRERGNAPAWRVRVTSALRPPSVRWDFASPAGIAISSGNDSGRYNDAPMLHRLEIVHACEKC